MKIKHTKVSLTGSILLFSAFAPGDAALFENDIQKPNVLFIIVDDLKPNLGCYGDEIAQTPNIDALAKKGVLMLSNYCQQAVCAPSRVSLFTGKRPDYTGVTDLKTNMRDVNPDILTIPQFFKQQGYFTVGFGKLLHGARADDPVSWTEKIKPEHSLPYAEGYSYPANGFYQNKASLEAFEEAEKQGMNWRQTNQHMVKKGARPSTEFLDVPDDAYRDGAIANAGIETLEKMSDSNQPFFLALGFRKPHLPFVAPLKYYNLYENVDFNLHPFREHAENSPEYAYSPWYELRNYSDIPNKGDLPPEKQKELIHAYYSALSYSDAQIGKVMDKLKELDLEKNTIIVLWGDHGWHLGDHGLWCKHTNFEQATHAPLIISAPGFKGDVKTSSLTEFVDVFPTLCELAGFDIPEHADGLSLVPLMKNPELEVRDFSVSQYPRSGGLMGYSFRTKRYRLTLWMKENFNPTKKKFDPSLIDAVELYDYRDDPLETHSKDKDPSCVEVKKELIKMAEEFFESEFQKYN